MARSLCGAAVQQDLETTGKDAGEEEEEIGPSLVALAAAPCGATVL